MAGLVLRPVDIAGPLSWRWLLLDAGTGIAVTDHRVRIDPAVWQFQAFAELDRYLRVNADPARRLADEARIVDRLGAWVAAELLGETVAQAIAGRAPVTVTVEVPDTLGLLPQCPWELAHADGVPLARQGVTMAYDLASGRDELAVAKQPAGDTLRILAVFSQPTNTEPLALRRERHALAGLVRELAGRELRRVELRVLQYGAGRETLRRAVEDGDGWDLLHISCHGGIDTLALEHSDGTPDPISTAALVAMLRPARHRVKLAVLSACESAAATTAQTLRWLGLVEQAEKLEEQAATALSSSPASSVTTTTAATATTATGTTGTTGTGGPASGGGLARGLVEALGCAVLAMRYPVGDEFAVRLAGQLYDRILRAGNSVDTAVRLAVPAAAGPAPSPAAPPAALVTPVLLGRTAVELRLPAPRGRLDLAGESAKTAHLRPEPERFVGRGAAMTRASAAIASGSGRAGVLFHGMAGAGKTACALELAYRHEDAFAAIAFWEAPERPDEYNAGLASLATALEQQIPGLRIVDKIATAERFAGYAPVLTKILARNGLLVVLDNLETLLHPDGVWRDPRWPVLLGALTGHQGLSRVVLTSRVVPAGLDGGRVLVEPVHALPRDEALLLARELAGLRALLHADLEEPGPVRKVGMAPAGQVDPEQVDADRLLVRRALRVVQGHPKLLELADAAAQDSREVLAERVVAAEAEAVGRGRALAAFFAEGDSGLDAAGFFGVLSDWVTAAVSGLSGPAGLLLEVVCCLEDDDRTAPIVQANWADVWRRLGRAGEAPEVGGLVGELAGAALVAVDAPPADAAGGEDAGPVGLRVHPGVAEAVRAGAGDPVRATVDARLAAFWRAVFDAARGREGGEDGRLVAQAGLSAAPYLLRLHEWDAAGYLLQEAYGRSPGEPGMVQAVLPLLRRVADATGTPDTLGVYGRVLHRVDPAGAEAVLRDALGRAVAAADHRLASVAAGELVGLLIDQGRLREALETADAAIDHTRRAGLGPWAQAGGEAQRLQVLRRMGEAGRVLADAEALLARLDALPAATNPVTPWNVREMVLQLAALAARDLEHWEQSLAFRARVSASEQSRGADEHERANTRFGAYGPLLRLGRLDEAETLLADCQRVFADAGDADMLGRVFSARAELAAARGRHAGAARLEQIAIRLKYTRPDPDNLAASHHNLANYLRRAGADAVQVLAHRLAAALLHQLTGTTSAYQANTMRMLAADLTRHPGAEPPATVAAVADLVEQVEGVAWAGVVDALLAAHGLGRPAADAALTEIIEAARTLPTDQQASAAPQELDRERLLAGWEKAIAAIVAAAGGDAQAADDVDHLLTELADTADWAALAAAFRRILAGERDHAELTAGLDPIDTAILTATLDRLTTPPAPPND